MITIVAESRQSRLLRRYYVDGNGQASPLRLLLYADWFRRRH